MNPSRLAMRAFVVATDAASRWGGIPSDVYPAYAAACNALGWPPQPKVAK